MFPRSFILLFCLFLFEATGQATDDFDYFEVTTSVEALTTESPNVTEEIKPSCNEGQWQCENGDCISDATLCDGFINCKDASDEYRKTCNGTDSRPLFGLLLHCMSWSENHEVCPQICHDAPEFCYYALIAENEKKDSGLCVLPEYPEHGYYKIVTSKNENSSTSNAFRLKYGCEKPFVFVEKTKHECIDGHWHNNDDNRYCSEACELNSYKNDSFIFSCAKDVDGNDTCLDFVAINTTVTVTKAYEDPEDQEPQRKRVSVELFCPPNTKKIDISTGCVDEVDKRQQAFESPTMTKMTQYEADFNKFKNNDTSSDFQELVEKFKEFEKVVRRELDEMHEMADKCDISLDLLLSHLQRKKAEQGIEN
ncbi:uncharacterized protein LOC125233978 [Leguminivora glycinivorella]|uniref:uncharacterized protein LOC125233978 n=1 Tax=Leguminivora glycinivorella TaxID=1035111 RepID=UPI00200E5D17|nr:uncharacterized protein LOC125233978 [Leguminivora glycinivorella]